MGKKQPSKLKACSLCANVVLPRYITLTNTLVFLSPFSHLGNGANRPFIAHRDFVKIRANLGKALGS